MSKVFEQAHVVAAVEEELGTFCYIPAVGDTIVAKITPCGDVRIVATLDDNKFSIVDASVAFMRAVNDCVHGAVAVVYSITQEGWVIDSHYNSPSY